MARRVALFVGALVLLTGYTWYGTTSIRLTTYNVSVAGLPRQLDGLRILHLSDLHGNESGRGLERLEAVVSRLDFDIAVMTGDFVDAVKQVKQPALDVVPLLKGKPTFYVFGNHDMRPGCDVTREFTSLGVQVLRDRAVAVPVRGGCLWIAGVDCAYSTAKNLGSALGGIPAGQTTVLLAHAPGIFEQTAAAGVDLVFTGHTHGGQVRLPFLGALWAPGQGFTPEHSWGLFRSGRTTMIVNAGLGQSIVPFRFNCRPEVVLVTLRSTPAQ